jgi:hypothetical protein
MSHNQDPDYRVEMLRNFTVMRGMKFIVLMAVMSIVIRTLASVGRPIARFADSDGYESFQIFGEINRMWPVPLMYSLVQSDVSRVMMQIAIGSVAWIWLAVVVSRITRWPRISFALILTLGLSPEVIRYDLTILSESLGISFAVWAFALSVELVTSPTRRTWILWFTSMAFCSMTRPTHLVIPAVVVLPHVIRFLASKGKKISVTTVALCALIVVGVVQAQANSSTSLLNLYTVLAERVMTDDDRYEWFVSRGMPDVAGTRDVFGYDYPADLPPEVAEIVQLPVGQAPPRLMRIGGVSLAQWAQEDGWKTYLTYTVTHPTDTASRLASLAGPTLSPPNGDFLPLDNGPMLPGVVFGSWQLWSVLLVVAAAMIYLRSPSRRLAQLFISLGVILVLMYAASTLTSGIEHPRHAVTVSVMLRVAGLSAILAALTTTNAWTNRDAHDDESS